MVGIKSEAHAVAGYGEVEIAVLDREVAEVAVTTSERRPRVGHLERAKRQLVVRPLGFAYAHEWPDAAQWGHDPLPPRAGAPDVDSGPVIPLVHAGAGASGMAVLAAASFHDEALLAELVTSLELTAFPERTDGKLRFRASNGLGDAVLLYATAQGPLWQRVRAGKERS